MALYSIYTIRTYTIHIHYNTIQILDADTKFGELNSLISIVPAYTQYVIIPTSSVLQSQRDGANLGVCLGGLPFNY